MFNMYKECDCRNYIVRCDGYEIKILWMYYKKVLVVIN